MKGKNWESLIRKKIKEWGYPIRLKDASSLTKFKGTRCICDIIFVNKDDVIFLEAKSRKGKSISFSDITQLDDLIELRAINKDIRIEIWVNFYEQKKKVFCTLDDLVRYKNSTTRKSVRYDNNIFYLIPYFYTQEKQDEWRRDISGKNS